MRERIYMFERFINLFRSRIMYEKSTQRDGMRFNEIR